MSLFFRLFKWAVRNIWRVVSLTLGLIILYLIVIIFIPIIEFVGIIGNGFDFMWDMFDDLEKEIEKFEWQTIEKIPEKDDSV